MCKETKIVMLYTYMSLWALTQMDKYYVCMKIIKIILKVQDVCTGIIMILNDINNNIITSHPFYSGVYQDKYEW